MNLRTRNFINHRYLGFIRKAHHAKASPRTAPAFSKSLILDNFFKRRDAEPQSFSLRLRAFAFS